MCKRVSREKSIISQNRFPYFKLKRSEDKNFKILIFKKHHNIQEFILCMYHLLCKYTSATLILYIVINIIYISMWDLSRKSFNLYNWRTVSFINKYYDSYNLTSKIKASIDLLLVTHLYCHWSNSSSSQHCIFCIQRQGSVLPAEMRKLTGHRSTSQLNLVRIFSQGLELKNSVKYSSRSHTLLSVCSFNVSTSPKAPKESYYPNFLFQRMVLKGSRVP